MYLLAKIEPSTSVSAEKARKIAIDSKFITTVCRVLDIFARLDEADTEIVAAKIQPHRISKMRDDVVAQLGCLPRSPSGNIPDLIEETAPVGETEGYSVALSQNSLFLDEVHESQTQIRGDTAHTSNDRMCRHVETNGNSKGFSQTPPLTFGRQRGTHALQRSSAAMRAPEYSNTIHQSFESQLATSSSRSGPDAHVTSVTPRATQSPPLPSHLDPTGGASPTQRALDEGDNETSSFAAEQLTLPTTGQRDGALLEDHRSSFAQVFGQMTSLFCATLSPANLIIIIGTGDKLVRDDAVPFLLDQLPLWKGMWHNSNLLTPSSNDSIIDHFVKVSRCITSINERSTMDRIRILLHKVLQYQFYLRFLEEVQQKAKDPTVKRKRGIRNSTYAMNHLLAALYLDDWELIDSAEKQRRRDLLHKQKYLGKRLMTLSSYMGFGILLLSSPEAMSRINNTEFTDDMFNALVCYIFNMYPEIPKLCRMLDKVVRQMVKSQTINEMRFHIESTIPSIEIFLQNRGDSTPPSQFTRIDLSIKQADPLEYHPATLHNQTGLVQDLRTEDIEINGEKGRKARTYKRRRVSL